MQYQELEKWKKRKKESSSLRYEEKKLLSDDITEKEALKIIQRKDFIPSRETMEWMKNNKSAAIRMEAAKSSYIEDVDLQEMLLLEKDKAILAEIIINKKNDKRMELCRKAVEQPELLEKIIASSNAPKEFLRERLSRTSEVWEICQLLKSTVLNVPLEDLKELFEMTDEDAIKYYACLAPNASTEMINAMFKMVLEFFMHCYYKEGVDFCDDIRKNILYSLMKHKHFSPDVEAIEVALDYNSPDIIYVLLNEVEMPDEAFIYLMVRGIKTGLPCERRPRYVDFYEATHYTLMIREWVKENKLMISKKMETEKIEMIAKSIGYIGFSTAPEIIRLVIKHPKLRIEGMIALQNTLSVD